MCKRKAAADVQEEGSSSSRTRIIRIIRITTSTHLEGTAVRHGGADLPACARMLRLGVSVATIHSDNTQQLN